VDDEVRKKVNLKALGCEKGDAIVNLRNGRPKSPLPAIFAEVKARHGWFAALVDDPAYSKNATVEDFYRHEQRVYMCLPHVSAVCSLAAAIVLLVVVEQQYACAEH
jgi:hypothetical protein